MKRMRVHVSVSDLEQSIRFYSKLFDAQPSVVEADYAKWALDDPRVNFAISAMGHDLASITSAFRLIPAANSRLFTIASMRRDRRCCLRRQLIVAMRDPTSTG